MHESNEPTLSMDAARLFGYMRDTFYWFDEVLNRFELELQALPRLHERLSTREVLQVNLPAGLAKIKGEINAFVAELQTVQMEIGWSEKLGERHLRSSELPTHELSQLRAIDGHFVAITDYIQTAAATLAQALDNRRDDTSDFLWDFDMEAEFRFVLSEEDPGFSEDSDNFLARRDEQIFPSRDTGDEWEFNGSDWPDGYEFDPMPHGLLFHALHHRGSYDRTGPALNLKDILRVGDVWVDLVVRYQFYYDVRQGKWVKKFITEGDNTSREYARAINTK